MKKLKFNLKALILGILGVLAIGTTVLAVSTPVPPGGVQIDSKLGVLNATKNQTQYVSSVNAEFDDVVNIEVYVHNPALSNSGKVANNVNIRVSLPSAQSTNHTVTSTVAGTNTNTDTQTAHVITNDPSTLVYIPGTAVRTYNAGTNDNVNWRTVGVSDNIVGSGINVGNVQPCCNFQESITFQARIMIPSITITKDAKIEGAATWQNSIQAHPGDTVAFLITVKNVGNTVLRNVMVRDSMPPFLQYVPGSAKMIDTNYPNGYPLSDYVVQGGANTGHYMPGAVTYVRLQARVPSDNSACGSTNTNVGHAKADNLPDYLNDATVSVVCNQVQEARIRIIKFNDMNGDGDQDSGEGNLAGWQFRVSGPSYDQTFTTDASGTVMITGLAAGRYTVTEVSKEGWENTTGLSLAKDVALGETAEYRFGNRQVTPPETPETPGGEITTLPSSGPVEMAGMFVGSLSISGGALAYLRSKKQLKDAYRK